MQIVINFYDIDLYDWMDFDDSGVDAPELKDIFKGEILNKFVAMLNADFAVRQYVKENIDNQLSLKISKYKDDVAIKAIVEDIITRRIKDTGSFIFLDRYKDDVTKAVDNHLKTYEKHFVDSIISTLKAYTEDIIAKLYKTSAIGEFIDQKKLADYVTNTILLKCMERKEE